MFLANTLPTKYLYSDKHEKTAGTFLRRSNRPTVVAKYKLAQENKANLKKLGGEFESDAEESFNNGTAFELEDDCLFKCLDTRF